jgi:hypothetical protein
MLSITFGLIALSAVLFVYRAKKHNKHANTEFSSKALPEQQLKRIENIVPTDQLDLLRNVLLVSLNIMYSLLSSIELGTDQHGMCITLFDKKFADICQALKKLTVIHGMYLPNNKTRDRAITAFVFYRVLYKNVIEDFYKAQNTNESRKQAYFGVDPFVLLKRLPSRLMLFLGSQNWRVYELQELVYGDLDKLQLNCDIAEIIKEVSYENAPTTQQLQESQEIIESLKTEQEQVTQPDAVELKKNDKLSEQEIMAHTFVAWLKDRLNSKDKRFRLNLGQFIFSESLKYGNNSIFVSDYLLNKYQSVRGVLASNLKQALSQANFTDDKTYLVQVNGEDVDLIRINDVPVYHEDLAVTIEEKIDES